MAGLFFNIPKSRKTSEEIFDDIFSRAEFEAIKKKFAVGKKIALLQEKAILIALCYTPEFTIGHLL